MIDTETVLASLAQATNPAVMVDFDGTISSIVTTPAAARPVDGAVEALSALARSGCRTVVLSGRPAAFLSSVLGQLDPAVRLVGHSGLETMVGGETRLDEAVAGWAPVVRQAVVKAEAALPDGVDLEDKGISLVFHYRRSPEREPAATELAARIAATSGLSMKSGRMNVELRPPVAVDKGTAVRRCLEGGIDWALFAGDDLVDLPAFDAIRTADVHGVCLAIGSAELPAELRLAADIEVASPQAFVELLHQLSAAL